MAIQDAKKTDRSNAHTEPQSAQAEEPQELFKSLARLEAGLETPVVSGEMVSWAAAVAKSLKELGEILRQEVNVKHPAVCAQIGREDPELLRQVDQLRGEDAQLLDSYAQFADQLSRFRDRAERAEPNEAKLDPQVAEIVASGLELVISIRKQEQALKTWLLEAFHRDTGFAD
jgi:hypothetical protein